MTQENGFTFTSHRKRIVTGGLRRPHWICRNVKQNVVLVRDCSGSMSGQKAKDASAASQDLVREVAQPINKDGFNVAVVDFSSSASVVNRLETATTLDGQIKPLGIRDSTNITAGLMEAKNIIDAAEANAGEGIHCLRPVVICFTDGCHNTGPHPREVAKQIKLKADLVTVAFGSDADEKLMCELATTPQHFYRCANGSELRSFLAAVGATMTGTMSQGINASEALASIQHQQ